MAKIFHLQYVSTQWKIPISTTRCICNTQQEEESLHLKDLMIKQRKVVERTQKQMAASSKHKSWLGATHLPGEPGKPSRPRKLSFLQKGWWNRTYQARPRGQHAQIHSIRSTTAQHQSSIWLQSSTDQHLQLQQQREGSKTTLRGNQEDIILGIVLPKYTWDFSQSMGFRKGTKK